MNSELANLSSTGAETGMVVAPIKVDQIAAVKSLLNFARRLGYLPFDVGTPLKSLRPMR